VGIENAFSQGQLPCISMEYVEGEDLAKRVGNLGFMSVSVALRYIRQIGEALQVVHEKGLLHREIKPANICVPVYRKRF
jgi:serine/threonine protein kinase